VPVLEVLVTFESPLAADPRGLRGLGCASLSSLTGTVAVVVEAVHIQLAGKLENFSASLAR
jgi:hypothetical protein